MAEIDTMRVVPNTKFPDHLAVAVTGNGPRFTHQELHKAADRIADQLVGLGIKPADAVAIVIPNTIEFIATYIGTTWARAVACPLNSGYKLEEFKFYLEDAGVKLVIVPTCKGNEAAEEAAATLRIPVYTAVYEAASHAVVLHAKTGAAPGAPVARSEPLPEDFAMFLHTSGTTSKPKCVQLTHRNLVTTLRNIKRTYMLTEEDRTLVVMPLFHVHGLMSATLTTLYAGGAAILPAEGRFSATTFWHSMMEFQCSWYTAVPTIHQILLLRSTTDFPGRAALSKLRFVRSCSSSLAPSVMAKLEALYGAPVLEAYAMTEAAHQMCSNPLPEDGARKPGTVGKPTGIQLTILDDKCQEVPRGTAGEVCIKGANVTPGYRNRPEANTEAFAGGWFHTGDQGFLDAEGYLTLTGRIKELINRGGEKISPLEVDAVLLAHPAVAEAVSYAVPDEKYGEEVNAVVILKKDSTATVADIAAHCNERMAPFKVPKKINLATDMPRTATGKIQRRIVAAHFLELEKTQ
eukprot:TRINITY_DN18090_c0_g1_i1.p1 TRINITY_DN18090_c0_g1~~TRINITY_DN18090_c0_g1_i1.p1  ORF type:complete len:519 (+),score=170.96 TRINITY_DN18090_c0_g1_i1:63-1619(+)